MAVLIQDENGGSKPYEKVVERLDKFRKAMKTTDGYGLLVEVFYPEPVKALEVIFNAGIKDLPQVKAFMELADATRVRARAQIVHPDGRVLASGEAEKDRHDNNIIDATAEWVQTKAIGRCLAAANYGTGEISTADEIMQELLAKNKLNAQSVGSVKPEIAGKSKSAKSTPRKKTGEPSKSNGLKPDAWVPEMLASLGIDMEQVCKDGIEIAYDDKKKELIIGGEKEAVLSLKSYLGAKKKWSFSSGKWRKKIT